jgi:hypothetical protein
MSRYVTVCHTVPVILSVHDRCFDGCSSFVDEGRAPSWPQIKASESLVSTDDLDFSQFLSGETVLENHLTETEDHFYPDTDPMTPAALPSQRLAETLALNDAVGVVQGAANTANGVQDGLVGLANLPGVVYNNTVGCIPGAPLLQYIPSPDWSNDLVTAEDPTLHAASKFLGGTGVTILVPGAEFAVPTASLGKVQVLAQAANGALVPVTRTVVVVGTRTVAVAAPGAAVAAEIAAGNVIQMTAGIPGGADGNAPNAKAGSRLPFEMRASADGSKGIYGDLKNEGMIEFFIEAGPQANPRGNVLFKEMINHFGDTAKGVVGSWTYGDNLAAFNRLTAQGMSLEEAAAQTWTGMQAARNGFTKVEAIAEGAPGAYTRVLA